MSLGHKWAVAGAVLVEVLLLVGILFGFKAHPTGIGVDSKTIREVCLAIWVVAVPAWFTTESVAFSPDPSDAKRVAEFARGQKVGQAIAALLGLVITTAIGLSPQASTQRAATLTPVAQSSTQAPPAR